jgi:hypothetical protein
MVVDDCCVRDAGWRRQAILGLSGVLLGTLRPSFSDFFDFGVDWKSVFGWEACLRARRSFIVVVSFVSILENQEFYVQKTRRS